ncbi:hypothetical protein NMY22_g7131 [Coprinellus aureogranulatus]|nr:hypothetical protein NMY22_g7131 [Coprinellus aureogranulatus]
MEFAVHHHSPWSNVADRRDFKQLQALDVYHACTLVVPQKKWTEWKGICNTGWPVRTEFVMALTSDFTTPKESVQKQIRKLLQSRPAPSNSPLRTSTTNAPHSHSTNDICRATLDVTVAPADGPSTPWKSGDKLSASTNNQGSIMTVAQERVGNARGFCTGRLEIKVTVGEGLKVLGSTQLPSTLAIPSSLLNVMVLPGYSLADTHIVLRSHFWEFEKESAFMFISDRELVTSETAKAEREYIDGEWEPLNVGARSARGIRTTLFNFPFSIFQGLGPLYAAKKIIHSLRLRPKSIVLNELLHQSGSLISHFPDPIQDLEVVPFFRELAGSVPYSVSSP